ncbi:MULTISPECIES: hypothetical protein [Sphingomonadales]|uniref:Uncharacterized protein n=1 Tax=Novosphingobium soli TaxID=574956 RepID=A0ABV6D2A8_9SPHN|nr:hypothetical protein [Sphingobium yanoikuyae]
MFDFHFLVNIRPKFDSWTMETVGLPARTPILSSWGLFDAFIAGIAALQFVPDALSARNLTRWGHRIDGSVTFILAGRK